MLMKVRSGVLRSYLCFYMLNVSMNIVVVDDDYDCDQISDECD